MKVCLNTFETNGKWAKKIIVPTVHDACRLSPVLRVKTSVFMLLNCVSANLSLKSFPETVKTGNKKRATCLATLLQNKLNSDVACCFMLLNCVSANLSLKSFPETVKTGNKKRATCLATLLQNKLNSDVACITTHIKPVSTNQIVNRFERWWQNVQHRYSTCSAAVLQDNYHVFCCPFLRTVSACKLLTVDLLDNLIKLS